MASLCCSHSAWMPIKKSKIIEETHTCISSSSDWTPSSWNLAASAVGNEKRRGVDFNVLTQIYSQRAQGIIWSQSMFIIHISTCQCFSQRPMVQHSLSTYKLISIKDEMSICYLIKCFTSCPPKCLRRRTFYTVLFWRFYHYGLHYAQCRESVHRSVELQE